MLGFAFSHRLNDATPPTDSNEWDEVEEFSMRSYPSHYMERPSNDGPRSSTAPRPRSQRSVARSAPAEEILIAVMGATGSGKTTFINSVSGSSMRTSSGLRSCTSLVEVAPSFMLDGKSVTLIDTPGFDDTTRTDTEILRMIAVFLSSTYQNGKKLAGVIFMHRISDFRVGGISTRNFRMFRELCGDNSLKNVVILTNMWGQVPEDLGNSREQELANDPLFFQPVLAKGAVMLRHDQTLESGRRVLRYLMTKDPQVLQIQREIVDEKKDILETAAGGELNRELLAQVARHKQEMEQLHREWQDAMDAKDEETRRELEEAERKLQLEINRIEGETRNLASDFERERRDFQVRLDEVNEEARRNMERMNEDYRLRIAELERQRISDNNMNEDRERELMLKIKELKEASRVNGSWVRTAGMIGLNVALLAVYPPIMRAIAPPPVVQTTWANGLASMASRALAAVV